MGAKLQFERDQEDLRRERAEAPQKLEKTCSAPAACPAKEADELVPALVAIKKRCKDGDPDEKAKVQVCLKTIRAYIDNLAQNPMEPKFQKINKENAAFKTRVQPFDEAVAVLQACGFRDEGSQLTIDPDIPRAKCTALKDVLTKVDLLMAQMK